MIMPSRNEIFVLGFDNDMFYYSSRLVTRIKEFTDIVRYICGLTNYRNESETSLTR